MTHVFCFLLRFFCHSSHFPVIFLLSSPRVSLIGVEGPQEKAPSCIPPALTLRDLPRDQGAVSRRFDSAQRDSRVLLPFAIFCHSSHMSIIFPNSSPQVIPSGVEGPHAKAPSCIPPALTLRDLPRDQGAVSRRFDSAQRDSHVLLTYVAILWLQPCFRHLPPGHPERSRGTLCNSTFMHPYSLNISKPPEGQLAGASTPLSVTHMFCLPMWLFYGSSHFSVIFLLSSPRVIPSGVEGPYAIAPSCIPPTLMFQSLPRGQGAVGRRFGSAQRDSRVLLNSLIFWSLQPCSHHLLHQHPQVIPSGVEGPTYFFVYFYVNDY